GDGEQRLALLDRPVGERLLGVPRQEDAVERAGDVKLPAQLPQDLQLGLEPLHLLLELLLLAGQAVLIAGGRVAGARTRRADRVEPRLCRLKLATDAAFVQIKGRTNDF